MADNAQIKEPDEVITGPGSADTIVEPPAIKDIPNVITLDQQGDNEAAALGMSPDNPKGSPKNIIEPDIDTLNIVRSAPDEVSDQDIQDVKDGKYDPVMEVEKYGWYPGYSSAIIQGTLEGFDSAGETIADVIDYFADNPDDPNYYANIQKRWNWIPDEYEAVWKEAANETVGRQFGKTISQFMAGFGPALKFINLLQKGAPVGSKLEKVVKSTLGVGAAGAVADFAVWDVADQRLTDLLINVGGDLTVQAAEELKANPDDPEAMTKFKEALGNGLTSDVLKSLQYDPVNDSKLMGRTKQAFEGFFLGKAVEGIALAVKQLGKLKPKNTTKTVFEEAADTSGNTKVTPKKTGKKTDDVLPLTRAKVKIVKEEQEQFTKAFFFEKDVEAAAAIIARNIDDALLNSTKDLDTVRNLNEVIEELIENTWAASKQTWDQAKAKVGKAYADNTDDLVKAGTPFEQTMATLEANAAVNAELSLRALKDGVISQAMSRRVLAAKDAVKSGKMTEEAFEKLYINALHVYHIVTSNASEVGRALNIRQYFTNSGEMDLAKIFKPVKDKGYNSTKHLIQILDDIEQTGTKTLPHKMLDKLATPGGIQMGEEIFRNSVLSITSLGVNITSNALMMMSRMAHNHAAAFRGGPISHKQSIGHTLGYIGAIPEAFVTMVKSMVTDVPQWTSKVDPRFANEFTVNPAVINTNKFFGAAINNPKNYFTKSMASTINVVGKILRGMPGATRTMMATDEFFKTLNYRAFVTKEAIAAAEDAGINFLTDPKGAAKYIADVHKKVMSAGPGMKYHGISKQSMHEAHVATFTEDFTWGQKLYEGIRSFPTLAFIMPFIRQPINGLKTMVRATPGLNLVSERVSRELAAGGIRAELELARLNLASTAWMSMALYLFSSPGGTTGGQFKKDAWNWENRFKGAYKKDSPTFSEDKDLGIDPNTYRTEEGDYINYRGLEPHAGKLVVTAGLLEDWMSMMQTLGDDISQEEYLQLAEQMALTGATAVLQSVIDQSSARGIQQLIEYAERPEQYLHVIAGIATPFSGFIKYMREQYMGHDLSRQDAGNSSQGYLTNLKEGMLNRYGGRTVPKLNMFGDPIPRAHPLYLGELLTNKDANWASGDTITEALANVIPTNTRKTHNSFKEPYQQEIIRIKNNLPKTKILGDVPRQIDGVKIDGKERHNLLLLFKHITPNGMTFQQYMETDIMVRDSYIDASDLSKAENFIKPAYQKYMEAAKHALLADAVYYRETGSHLPEVANIGLLEYDRSEALSKTVARSKARDNNLLYPEGDKNNRPMSLFEEKYQEGDARRLDKASQIFK